jgi:hypothetical protein
VGGSNDLVAALEDGSFDSRHSSAQGPALPAQVQELVERMQPAAGAGDAAASAGPSAETLAVVQYLRGAVPRSNVAQGWAAGAAGAAGAHRACCHVYDATWQLGMSDDTHCQLRLVPGWMGMLVCLTRIIRCQRKRLDASLSLDAAYIRPAGSWKPVNRSAHLSATCQHPCQLAADCCPLLRPAGCSGPG